MSIVGFNLDNTTVAMVWYVTNWYKVLWSEN